eukprot:COSAG06_NODE_49381_length_325_cov_12.349558_1_plen_95_part_10
MENCRAGVLACTKRGQIGARYRPGIILSKECHTCQVKCDTPAAAAAEVAEAAEAEEEEISCAHASIAWTAVWRTQSHCRGSPVKTHLFLSFPYVC